MSSSAVRVWFRDKVSDINGLPFFDTLSRVPDERTLPPLWCTLEFNGSSETRLSLGTSNALFRETGQVNVIIAGKSGRGDTAVIEAAEQVRALLTGISESVGTPAGHFYIDAPEPPSTDPTESGNWFLASVTCPYVFDVVR